MAATSPTAHRAAKRRRRQNRLAGAEALMRPSKAAGQPEAGTELKLAVGSGGRNRPAQLTRNNRPVCCNADSPPGPRAPEGPGTPLQQGGEPPETVPSGRKDRPRRQGPRGPRLEAHCSQAQGGIIAPIAMAYTVFKAKSTAIVGRPDRPRPAPATSTGGRSPGDSTAKTPAGRPAQLGKANQALGEG